MKKIEKNYFPIFEDVITQTHFGVSHLTRGIWGKL